MHFHFKLSFKKETTHYNMDYSNNILSKNKMLPMVQMYSDVNT